MGADGYPLLVTRVLPALALVLGALTACGGGATTTQPPATSAPAASPTPTPPSGQVVVITEEDFKFVPSTFAIRTDQNVTIRNKGTTIHNFSIAGTQADIDTQAGKTTRLEAIGGAAGPGTYQLFCKYHQGQGMKGTIIVVQGQAAPSYEP
jgi:plastocyanin